MISQGISTSQAELQLKNYGFNELPSAKPKNIFSIATEVMKEPMFLLLLSCGTLYFILANYQEGIVLLSAIFMIIGITFYQYQKTERALEALKNLSSPRALVNQHFIPSLLAASAILIIFESIKYWRTKRSV